MFKRIYKVGLSVLFLLSIFLFLVTGSFDSFFSQNEKSDLSANPSISLEEVPEYSNTPYVTINQGLPEFSQEDLNRSSFESYSPLDALGRVGPAMAMIGTDLMPTKKRGSISEVKPSGWVQADYDFIDGGKLYNRCHLIAYQLTAEGKNKENLMTGTRYLNTEGMLPFENQIADYIRETDQHVLYRVTPIFQGDDLVARGVQLEALSVEDNGASVCFNVFCYNVEPGVIIDYKTGDSSAA